MIPKLRLWLELAAGLAVVLVGLVALHEHDAHIREQAVAQAVEGAQNAYQKQLGTLSADFEAKVKQRDQEYQAAAQSLNDKFAEAQKSQAQMAALLSKLGNLPVPITVTTPAPTKDNPTPTPIVTVPQADFSAVTLYAQQCEQCKLDRDKAKADLADRQAQQALAQKQIDSLKLQRDAALTAAKGGTVWKRTFKVLKVVACASAGGAAGGASGKGAVPAAIGAGAGAVACSLL